VIDRGYVDYAWFGQLTTDGAGNASAA
jgi:hypothetical protein